MNETTQEGNLTTADLPSSGDRREIHNTADVEHHFAGSRGGAGTAKDPAATPLFPSNEAEQFRGRWTEIQTGFVDEPRRAVEQADELVAQCMKRLAETFADERRKMEQQWDRDEDVSTEDLRLALQRYRSFFGRLLSV
jgi:hypothetical protein